MTSYAKFFDENKKELLDEFFTFLSFPGISTDTAYHEDLARCREWVKQKLLELGMEVEVWQPENGAPAVLFASNLEAGADKPTVLFYNHYDVQPVDPLDLWTSPPFEPALRNGEIYARGAQDNKGQCFYVLAALKAIQEIDGSFPVNIKLVIEGEEEIGSHGLAQLLPGKKEQVKADALLVVDTGMKSLDQPAITLGIRGVLTMDVDFFGSKNDLHSGSHGGVVYNPLHALVEVLAKLHDRDGRVTVPGFYDKVSTLSEKEREAFDFDFNEERYLDQIGCEPTGGESGFSPYERAWLRPTLEINGIQGGYAGEGFKTVIPAEAHAKISCRLVANQDPIEIADLVADYIESIAPPGIRVNVKINPGKGAALQTSPHTQVAQTLTKAFTEVFKKPCRCIMEGGSIPIASLLQQVSGAETVMVGLGLPTDNMHAPDEHFGVERLKLGMCVMAHALNSWG